MARPAQLQRHSRIHSAFLVVGERGVEGLAAEQRLGVVDFRPHVCRAASAGADGFCRGQAMTCLEDELVRLGCVGGRDGSLECDEAGEEDVRFDLVHGLLLFGCVAEEGRAVLAITGEVEGDGRSEPFVLGSPGG